MDFWCHASALFALSWARATSSCSWRAAAAAVRTPGAHSGFTEHTERHRGEQHLR